MKKETNSFEDVQKVLALKRHEQPPPPFFNRFSNKVIDRLHSPQPPEPLNWCQRLGLGDDPKPILLCVLGLVVCGALGLGLIAALRVEKPPKTLATQAGDPSVSESRMVAGEEPLSLPGFQPLGPEDSSSGMTVPVIAPLPDGSGTEPKLTPPAPANAP